MNIQKYLEKRKQLSQHQRSFRELCTHCIQPISTCYCSHIQKFNPQIDFVILIHPIEVRRRIATGRMSHLCLENSKLIRGHDYTRNASVNEILAEEHRHCVILYPGRNSQNLTDIEPAKRHELFPKNKKLTIFVIDGTWMTAKKMMKHSQNLVNLPRICFSPEKPSNFRVRKQPHPACYSTIEAIHHTLELIGPTQGFNTQSRTHDRLLTVFDAMVEVQLGFVIKSHKQSGPNRYRRHAETS